MKKIEEDHGSKSVQISMRGARKEVVLGNRGRCGQHHFGELREASWGVILVRASSVPPLLSLCSNVRSLYQRFFVLYALQIHLGSFESAEAAL